MGWIIAGVIIVLFVIALLYEGYRTPRVEAWFQLHDFVRLCTPLSEEVQTQLKRFARMFGPLNRAWHFGFVCTKTLSDSDLTIAEYDSPSDSPSTPKSEKGWFTLFALVAPGSVFGEFRAESIDQTAEGIGRVIQILLFPVFLVLRVLTPKHEETEVLLTPVDFPEDPAFNQAYRVYGDSDAAKRLLTSDARLALVQRRWEGEMAAADNTFVWRRKGLLKPARMDSLLSEIELMKALFLK